MNSAGNYYLRVTDSNGCKDTSGVQTITVNSNPSPVVVNSGSDTFCEGDSVQLDAGAGYTVYSWLPDGQNTQKIIVKKAGNYSVAVTNASTCSGSSARWRDYPLSR